MTHRQQLLILALLIALLLVFALFPRQAGADAPVGATAVPAGEFVPVSSSAVPISEPLPVGAECREWALGCRRYPAPATVGTAEELNPSPSASSVPSATPVRIPAPTERAGAVTGHSLRGDATWYRYVVGGAAAGPRLRAALGPAWRGHSVTVCAAVCVRVRLSDWMAADRLVDLDSRSFARLAPLSQGLQEVTISW